jgi:hypothetical protein
VQISSDGQKLESASGACGGSSYSFISVTTLDAVTPSATEYAQAVGSASTTFGGTEPARRSVIPVGGTLDNAYLLTYGAQPADAGMICNLRKNQSNTSISITVPANSPAATYTDLSHSVTVNAGDNLSWSCQNSSTLTSAGVANIAMRFLAN